MTEDTKPPSRRWHLWLIRGLVGASAALLVLSIALWIVSEFRIAALDCRWDALSAPDPRTLTHRVSAGNWEVSSLAGCFRYDAWHEAFLAPGDPPARATMTRWWNFRWENAAGIEVDAARWGVEIDTGTGAFVPPDSRALNNRFCITVRYWLLTPLFAVPLIAWGWQRHRHRRAARAGHCPGCGYDLRASPQRCPECGRLNPISFECRA